jgi:hypothetical protein
MKRPIEDLGAEGLKGFHLGYLAAAARLRREMPMTWRSMVLNALAHDPLDREDAGIESAEVLRHAPHLRGCRLAVARCEAAATMLSWRKELPARHREAFRAAMARLITEAQRLGAM